MNKRKNEDYKKNSIIIFLTTTISLLISVIVAIISVYAEFDGFQTMAMAMLSFMCSEYFVHSLMMKSKYFKAKHEYNFMESVNEWTDKLYEMNRYCEEIVRNRHGKKDLFIVTCAHHIDNLYYVLKTAALEKRIEITTDYIINSTGVFEALNVASAKRIELTFPIDEIKGKIMQSAEDEKFFETAYKMVKDGQVEKIRVLLILGDSQLLENEKLLALCSFYQANAAYECRYILKSDFQTACEHNLIPTGDLDFGIYGPKMLFRVEQYDPYRGIYSKDEDQVRRYLSLYNEVWDFEAVTHSIPSDTTVGEITPKELFDKFDKFDQLIIEN